MGSNRFDLPAQIALLRDTLSQLEIERGQIGPVLDRLLVLAGIESEPALLQRRERGLRVFVGSRYEPNATETQVFGAVSQLQGFSFSSEAILAVLQDYSRDAFGFGRLPGPPIGPQAVIRRVEIEEVEGPPNVLSLAIGQEPLVICPPEPPDGIQLTPENYTIVGTDPGFTGLLDGQVRWEQIAGTNSVQFNNPTALYPLLLFPDFGNAPGSDGIILRVTVLATGESFELPVEETPSSNFSASAYLRGFVGYGFPAVGRVESTPIRYVPFLEPGFEGAKFGDALPGVPRFPFAVPDGDLLRTEIYLFDPQTGARSLSESIPAGRPIQPAIPFGVTAWVVPVYSFDGRELPLDGRNITAFQPPAIAPGSLVFQAGLGASAYFRSTGLRGDIVITPEQVTFKDIVDPTNSLAASAYFRSTGLRGNIQIADNDLQIIG